MKLKNGVYIHIFRFCKNILSSSETTLPFDVQLKMEEKKNSVLFIDADRKSVNTSKCGDIHPKGQGYSLCIRLLVAFFDSGDITNIFT